jgi:beta,beta-carotene 9',10'-dioxygenase
MASTINQTSDSVWDNAHLYTSIKETNEVISLPIEGKVPEWLKGTLYRNGPGAFEINDDPNTSFNHAFDGFSFIQKYSIDGPSQSVVYRGSFVKSKTYTESMKQGHLTNRKFGTDPCKSIFGRFQSAFKFIDPIRHVDDTGVTVQKINDELLALTETVSGNILDPHTLESIGTLTALPYAKMVPAEIITISTAHIMYDAKRKMNVGYAGRITYKKHWLDVIFMFDDPKSDTETGIFIDRS